MRLSASDAANRVPVRLVRPDRPIMVGTLLAVPVDPRTSQVMVSPGAQARVILSTGAVVSVPVDQLERIEP